MSYLEMLSRTGYEGTKETKEVPSGTPLNSFNSSISYPDRLKTLASEAIQGLAGYITPRQLLAKLAPEDLAAVEMLPGPVAFLRSFATAIVWTEMRRQGIAPPGWDKPAHCDQCGDVYLWAPIRVAGCPWCWNRLHGIRIPRPC